MKKEERMETIIGEINVISKNLSHLFPTNKMLEVRKLRKRYSSNKLKFKYSI